MVRLDALLAALDLRPDGPGRYRATNADNGQPVVFGGQLLAQSLVAALAADDSDKRVKTIHTIFARAGSPELPVEIEVEVLHAGRAFASSTVSITQGGSLCTRSSVLLSAAEPDFISHADEAPTLASPADDLATEGDDAFQLVVSGGVDLSDPDQVGPPDLDVWVRVPDAPDHPGLDEALLAYISDGFLIGTAMRPHPGVGQAQAHVSVVTAVVSHTLTFHRPLSMRSWQLLSHHATFAGGGRCHGRAHVFDGSGELVASYVQDGLLRGR